ncbi:MAG: BA14K family protein [Hyphomicrobiaceae bacterium]
MNKHMRHAALGFLALGLTSIGGFAALAQDVDEDGYVIQERTIIREPAAPTAEIDDDDDEVVMASRDGMQRCADTFRSFDSSTGTYVTYDGETRTCPYLE